ncbi:MAG: hypothetical protein IPL46_30545 [Saprospiraceae bacterium]|nr:hypothetical protein [Saprospiraceae bacterium]
MIISIVLGILFFASGCVVTAFVYQKQKKKRKLKLTITDNQNSAAKPKGFFQNSDGDQSISIHLVIKNLDRVPVTVSALFLGIRRHYLQGVSANYPVAMHNISLPHTLGPGEQIVDVWIGGYDLFLVIEDKLGDNNKIMLGCIDQNDNEYCSKMLPVDLKQLKRDKGRCYFS